MWNNWDKLFSVHTFTSAFSEFEDITEKYDLPRTYQKLFEFVYFTYKLLVGLNFIVICS